MKKNLTKAETAAWLRSHDRYCILTHRKPDGDTVGCAAALCRALRAMGKTAHVLLNPELTEKYRGYHVGLTCTEAYPGATLISVDTASPEMLPAGFAHLKDKIALSIDHHPSNSGYAQETLVDAEAAACGEIVYDLLNVLQIPMTREMADDLYVAVSTDTGCFRYSNTTGRTLRTAAGCVEAGADLYGINKALFETHRLSRLKLNAYMAEHLEMYADGRIAFCLIPLEVEHSCGVTEDDLDSVSNFARNVEGVEFAATLRTEFTGQTKVSVRCAPGYDANRICKVIGGGGHVAAAGARVDHSQEETKQMILQALKDLGYM